MDGVRDLILDLKQMERDINYLEYPFSGFEAAEDWISEIEEDGTVHSLTTDGYRPEEILNRDGYFDTDVSEKLQDVQSRLLHWKDNPPHGISTPRFASYLDNAMIIVENIDVFLRSQTEMFYKRHGDEASRVEDFVDVADSFFEDVYYPIEQLYYDMDTPDNGPMFGN